MTRQLFIQIHTLTSYPASLLNRDDIGLSKRVPFGGCTRTRISSQCLKRHWRQFEGEYGLTKILENGTSPEKSIRSRFSFENYILQPLVESGISKEIARAATEAVMKEALGENKAKKDTKKQKVEDGETKEEKHSAKEEKTNEQRLRTAQITVLGKQEIDFFLQEARKLAGISNTVADIEKNAKDVFTKEWGKNLKGLRQAAGLDAALFGRMVTSDKLARADSAVQVAHAFTVHEEQVEPDYFTAVDDLLRGEDGSEQLGSAHIGTTELTTGVFYGYVVIDVAQLISNLEGVSPKLWRSAKRELGAQVAQSLVHLTRVSPGAKIGSTAPYSYPHFVMVETGSTQPRTLANAFLAPVTVDRHRPDMIANSFTALQTHMKDLEAMYGVETQRALAALGPKDEIAQLGGLGSLVDVAKFAARAITEAEL